MRSHRLCCFAFAVLVAGAGCSSPGDGEVPEGGAGASCALTAPTACPTVIPSWSKDVQPIVNRTCAPCHFDGGAAIRADGYDYSTYAGFKRPGSTTTEFQLLKCLMPQDGGTSPLTTAEGNTLLSWIVCQEPDN